MKCFNDLCNMMDQWPSQKLYWWQNLICAVIHFTVIATITFVMGFFIYLFQ